MSLQQVLTDYGVDTVQKIRQKIVDTDTIDTGALLNSIDYVVVPDGNSFDIEFFMNDYGRYTDEGTIRIDARKFFNEVIDQNYNLWSERIVDAVIQDLVLAANF
jgi:hypothetical protein